MRISAPGGGGSGTGDMLRANNLSDVLSASTSRTNLGLGTLATQNGTFSGTSSGTNTGDQTTVSGNAGTATKLAATVTINGVAFDGSANITVTSDANTLSGTTLKSTVVTSSLTALGTIATGVWQGTIIGPTYGGTGINNGSFTITLAGNLVTSGAFALTLTQTGTTNVTLPTSGTLATRAGSEVLTTKTYQGGNFGTDAGSTDDYVITLSPIPTAYVAGMAILFVAATSNTTGATLNVNGLGQKAIVKRASTALATGDIVTGMRCFVVYDGTNFILINPVVN
jgi:hypothetical protein